MTQATSIHSDNSAETSLALASPLGGRRSAGGRGADVSAARAAGDLGAAGVAPGVDLSGIELVDVPDTVSSALNALVPKVAAALKQKQRARFQLAYLVFVAHQICAKAGQAGRFSDWVRAQGMSRASAYNHQRLWQRFGNCTRGVRFTEQAMVCLSRLGVPEEAVTLAMQRAEHGTQITLDEAKSIIREVQQVGQDARPAAIVIKAEQGDWTIVIHGAASHRVGDVLAAALANLEKSNATN